MCFLVKSIDLWSIIVNLTRPSLSLLLLPATHKSLDEAKDEIKKLRELATTALSENVKPKPKNDEKRKL